MRQLLIGLALLLARSAAAEPPTVVKAVPDNGDVDVDPATRTLVITFDQPMERGMSVVGGGDEFPEIVGRPRWTNNRTLTIAVRLQADHDYRLSINSDQYKNFTNAAGEAAVPYPIHFRTGGGEPPMDEPVRPGSNQPAVDKLLEALTLHYSHRDRLGLTWAELVDSQRAALGAASNPREFAELAATILAQAQDKHIWLQVGQNNIPAYVNPVTPNINPSILPQVIPQWRTLNKVVGMGQWPDGVGYVAINSWDRSQAASLLAVFEAIWELHDAPALIIDLRMNGGGDESMARTVAGCFLDQQATYARRDRVDPDNPGTFTPPYDSVVEPSKQRPRYRGRLAVLIGPAVISSCESFVLMMKQAPDTVLVGAPTQGSSGNPQPHDLGNGVTLFLPSWREMTPDGSPVEGRGIEPDIAVTTTRESFAESDPVLDAALKWLQSR